MDNPQQRNWFLIVGVSLPVVLLLGFFGYTQLLTGTVEPPAHDLYFAAFPDRASDEPQHASLQYLMRDERIEVRVMPASNGLRWNQYLYRLDHDTLKVSRIEVAIPAELEAGSRIVAIPELADVRVSSDTTAPDGYRFRSGFGRGPGLIGELFYRNQDRAFTIEKHGAVHRFSAPDGGYGYGRAQFLGWVYADD